MSEEIAIRVRGLVTRFGAQTVHDGLDLDVRRGEILGVVGPSGTGKSVLLREIVELEAPRYEDLEGILRGIELIDGVVRTQTYMVLSESFAGAVPAFA